MNMAVKPAILCHNAVSEGTSAANTNVGTSGLTTKLSAIRTAALRKIQFNQGSANNC